MLAKCTRLSGLGRALNIALHRHKDKYCFFIYSGCELNVQSTLLGKFLD